MQKKNFDNRFKNIEIIDENKISFIDYKQELNLEIDDKFYFNGKPFIIWKKSTFKTKYGKRHRYEALNQKIYDKEYSNLDT